MDMLRRLFFGKAGSSMLGAGGFNPFGSWEEFSSTLNRTGYAYKSLVGQIPEQGTWIPSVGGDATYFADNHVGRWTRVGRQIFIEGSFVIFTIGTGSTSVISGLPFTNNSKTFGGVSVFWAALALNRVYVMGRINPGANTIILFSAGAAAATLAPDAILGNGASLTFTGSYSV